MAEKALPTPYDEELSKIGATLKLASEVELGNLKSAIAGASQDSIIAVGSGGSYTVAALLCSLHEKYTGHVSRPVTPLELICNPTLASTSPIFVISAEGKNPDILEALRRARERSSRTVHVLTNRDQSPLMEVVNSLNDVTPHVFSLVEKDGYLATNSLVLDASLTARAYGELDNIDVDVSFDPNSIAIEDNNLGAWLESSDEFFREACKRRGLIIVFSPRMRPIAEDLESKLSESALLYTQLADFRSFAHGRHLWLTNRTGDSALLVLTEPGTTKLWEEIREEVPDEVPVCVMSLADVTPIDLISGLIAGMHFVSKLADQASVNIAKPQVSDFGRRLYYADLEKLITSPVDADEVGLSKKYDVLGAHWPNARGSGKVRRARNAVLESYNLRNFRAVVFDYDGTLCSSNSRDFPPPSEIINQLVKLVSSGVLVGVASGRGDSIIKHFRDFLDQEYWPLIRLGLYNGGWIGGLEDTPQKSKELGEFLIHANRIVSNLKISGVPISSVRPTAPYQLSIRFADGVDTQKMWFVVVDAFKQAGLESSTIQRSKHSIDVLSRGVSKSHLIAHIVQNEGIDPYEILTMGDLGAWPGNDSSLLQHAYSLSVDLPSRRLDRGWNLAPRHLRDVDATLWYLERMHPAGDGLICFEVPERKQ